MIQQNRLSRNAFLKLAGAAASVFVVSCASTPGAPPTAAPAPTTAPAAPASPTTAPAQPTAAPTSVPAQPTATLAAATPTAAPAAQAAPQAAKKKVTLEAATWFAAKLPTLYQWKSDYEQQFPDRSVEILREDYDLTKALLEAKQKKFHADIILPITAFIDMAPAVEANVIASVSDYLPKDWPTKVPKAFVDESTYKGKIYQWPYAQVGSTVNFRKSLLAKAGHEGQTGTKLSDYFAVCADVQSKLKAPDGSTLYGNSFDLAWWRAPTTVGINTMGRDFFGSDGYLAWDDKRLVDLFNTLKQLAKYAPKEIFLPGYSSVDAFAAGKAAMFLGQSEQVFYLAKATWGPGDLQLAYPPIFPGGENNPRTIVASGGAAFYQNGNLDNSWHFYEWLWSKEEFHQAIATVGNWIPVRVDLYDAKWMPDLTKSLVELIKTGAFIPATLHYLELATHAKNAVTAYLLDQIKTPEEAIKSAKQNFDDAVAKSG